MFWFILMWACFAIGVVFQSFLAIIVGIVIMCVIWILATLGTPGGITIDGDKM